MDLKNVEEALLKNAVFDQSFRNDILELAAIFNQAFPKISLNHLCDNLKNLKIERVSKFVSPMPIDYNAKLNKLIINESELEKVDDSKNLMMNIIIRLIATRNGITGFDTDGSFLALNLGYIAGMANMLVGNEAEHDIFADEIIAANIFGKLIGDDILAEAFFGNNPSLILDQAVNKGE